MIGAARGGRVQSTGLAGEGEARVLSTIHWIRVLVAGVLSEVGVIVVLLASIATYKKLSVGATAEAKPGEPSLGERIGYYVAPAAGFVTTGLATLWAVRGLDTGIIANAVAVGIVSVLITSPFVLSARPEHRLMYCIAFVLRPVAAYLAGVVSSA